MGLNNIKDPKEVKQSEPYAYHALNESLRKVVV